MILEDYKKKIEDAEDATKPAPQPTLKEVLANKDKSVLFGDLLKREGDTDLAERVAKGELKEDDIAALEEKRGMFGKAMQEAEVVKSLTTPEAVKDFARNNPEFEKILNLVGPESASKIFQKKIEEISINDPDRFMDLSNRMKAMQSFKNGQFADLNNEVRDLCLKRGIGEKRYAAALAIEDPRERMKAIHKVVTENWSGWKKAADFFTLGSWSRKRARFMEMKKDDIDATLVQLRLHQNNVGAMLAGTVDGNEEMRKMFAAELTAGKIKGEPKLSFKDMKQELESPENYTDLWTKHKKDKLKNWDTLSDDNKQKAVDKFIGEAIQKLLQKYKGKEGSWAQLMKIMMMAMIKGNRNKYN
ncbi:MAG TPA: hypothetical protein VG982_01965 [Candidatus Paceibacterota bacterium]|nr:hypothetical protein [Candidatus Paceibacterota bacterium]